MKPWHWTSLALLLSAATATAAEIAPSSDGPTWQTIALGCIAIITALIAGYARGLQGRLDKLETVYSVLASRLTDMDKIVARDYHTKADMEKALDRAISPLAASVKAVHARLDFLRISSYSQRGEVTGGDR